MSFDTLDEQTWRKTDRPHNSIKFDVMLDGICSFAQKFTGRLVTETMLIKDQNDDRQHIEKTADFIRGINCATAYLSIPTRPPAQNWVMPPGEQALNQAYQVFDARGINAEYLIGYEGNQFAFTGNIEADILSITSVHPMRQDAVTGYLKKAGSDFSVIEKLLEENKLQVSEYQNERFYIRTLANHLQPCLFELFCIHSSIKSCLKRILEKGDWKVSNPLIL